LFSPTGDHAPSTSCTVTPVGVFYFKKEKFKMDGQLVVTLVALFIGLLVAAGVFLLGREIVLWYFRINQIADDLHVIANHYRALDTGKRPAPVSNSYSGIGSAPAPMRK
jgi:hypothetical protein